MLGGRVYAYLVTGLWVIFPVLVIHYFLADYHSRYVDMTLPSAVGLSDRSATSLRWSLLLVAAYFTLRLARTGRRSRRARSRIRHRIRLRDQTLEPPFRPRPRPRTARRAEVPRARSGRRGDAPVAARPWPSGSSAGSASCRSSPRIGTDACCSRRSRSRSRGFHLNLGRYLPLDWGRAPPQPRRLPRVHVEPADGLLHRRSADSSASSAARGSRPSWPPPGSACYLVVKGSCPSDITSGSAASSPTWSPPSRRTSCCSSRCRSCSRSTAAAAPPRRSFRAAACPPSPPGCSVFLTLAGLVGVAALLDERLRELGRRARPASSSRWTRSSSTHRRSAAPCG